MRFIHKLISGYRRWSLGSAYKHQYNCHPAFDLIRQEDYCQVIWQKQLIAQLPYAHQFSHTVTGPCFIVASGPSLADIDIQRIRSYPSLCLNGAIKKFTSVGLTPTYCLIVDHRVFERQWSCVVESITSGATCFFSFEGLSIIAERAPALLQQPNIVLIESATRKYGIPRRSIAQTLQQFQQDPDILLAPDLLPYCRAIGFSLNLKKGVFAGKTVATWAVQLAVGMGFDTLYMLGLDLGGTGKAHFYADPQNPKPDFLRYYEPHIRGCFTLAREACEKNSVKLYNLSLNSALPGDIIPKMGFEEALEKLAQAPNSDPKPV